MYLHICNVVHPSIFHSFFTKATCWIRNISSRVHQVSLQSRLKLVCTETIFPPYYHKSIFLVVRHFLFVSPQSVFYLYNVGLNCQTQFIMIHQDFYSTINEKTIWKPTSRCQTKKSSLKYMLESSQTQIEAFIARLFINCLCNCANIVQVNRDSK